MQTDGPPIQASALEASLARWSPAWLPLTLAALFILPWWPTSSTLDLALQPYPLGGWELVAGVLAIAVLAWAWPQQVIQALAIGFVLALPATVAISLQASAWSVSPRPAMTIAMLLALAVTGTIALVQVGLRLAPAVLLSLLGAISVGAALWTVGGPLNPVASSCWALAAITLWIGRRRSQPAWLLAGAGFVTVAALDPRAHPTMGIPLLAVLVLATHDGGRTVRLAALVPAAIICGRAFMQGPPRLAWLAGALCISLAGLNLLGSATWRRRLASAAPGAMLALAAAVLLIVAWRDPGPTAAMLASSLANALQSQPGQLIWALTAIALLLASALPPLADARLPALTLAGLALAAAALSAWLGSAAGLPVAAGVLRDLFPLTVWFLMLKYAPGLIHRPSVQADPDRRQHAVAALVGLACAGALALSLPAHNFAAKAVIVESPAESKEHPLQRAFQPGGDEDYAAADPGPVVLIFRLERPIRTPWIEFTQYSPDEVMTDYAWHVSQDGLNWTQVYESRSPSPDAVERVEGLTTRLRVPRRVKTDYVRLTFRSSRGQNRLLLRRIAVGLTSRKTPRQAIARLLTGGRDLSVADAPDARTAPSTTRPALPFDLAVGATVISGPAFKHGHGLPEALRGGVDAIHWAEPVETEPFATVIDLGRTGLISAVCTIEHPEGARLGDHLWETSADSVSWHPLYGTDGQVYPATAEVACTTYWITTRQPVSGRYLRLTAAAFNGQGSWRLAGLRVLSAPPRRFKVVSGPEFSEGHGFERTLCDEAEPLYAAAAGPGPAEVVLDGGAPQSARTLQMVEYDPALAFIDFAWHASLDGANWVEVFDSRNGPAGRESIDQRTSRFDLRGVGCFRFLRLTFRSALGQNRLLLRRIRVLPEILTDCTSAAAELASAPAAVGP